MISNKNFFSWCLFLALFVVQVPLPHAADAVNCPELTQKVFKSVSLKSKILDENGKPLEKYLGMEGYAQFAVDYVGAGIESNMGSVFEDASAVLGNEAFKLLNWQQFSRTVEVFRAFRGKILDENGRPLEKYLGMEGYAQFAIDYVRAGAKSNMHSVFTDASAVLGKTTFELLNWHVFSRTVEDFRAFRGKILDADGNPLEKYVGMEGYAQFAVDYIEEGIESNMGSVFQDASAVLGEEKFKLLNWHVFSRTVEDFRAFRGKILDENGKPLEKYLGMEGYARFAKEHGGAGVKSNMQSIFKDASAVLGEETFKLLNWQQFSRTVEVFRAFRGKILDENGRPLEKYLGMEGYARFAIDYVGAGVKSNMRSVFQDASAVLGKTTFELLDWQQFSRTVEVFRAFRGKILDENGRPLEKYLGMEGYARFAIDYVGAGVKSNMRSVFQDASAVLGKTTFELLDWQQFSRTVEVFRAFRGKILDENGKPLKKYLGMEGYARFAKKHGGAGIESNMKSVFKDASAVLGKTTFELLDWQQFSKTVEVFRAFRGKILDENGKPLEKYLGMEGYAQFAIDYVGAGVKSKMGSVFTDASAVLGEETFKLLNWQQFSRTVEVFRAFRGKILDENGEPLEKYLGMEGYARFAKKHGGAGIESKMGSIFQDVSAVLGGKKEMNRLVLGWKKFQGSVSQYEDLIELFSITDTAALQGLEGQKFVADKIFKGGTISTYRNVSVLRLELLGDREAFKSLGWSSSKF